MKKTILLTALLLQALFAHCGNETSAGYADVDWFENLIQ